MSIGTAIWVIANSDSVAEAAHRGASEVLPIPNPEEIEEAKKLKEIHKRRGTPEVIWPPICIPPPKPLFPLPDTRAL